MQSSARVRRTQRKKVISNEDFVAKMHALDPKPIEEEPVGKEANKVRGQEQPVNMVKIMTPTIQTLDSSPNDTNQAEVIMQEQVNPSMPE
jgi:hypothetical protein